MSFYALLADVLVGVHLVYIAIVILGQLAIMIGWPLGWNWIRNPWFRVTHLVMILIVAVEAVNNIECPLTTWERELRIAAGQIPANFAELAEWQERDLSFIGGWMRRIMFFDSSWTNVLNWCYYAVAGIVVLTVILVPPRFRKLVASQPVPSADVNVGEIAHAKD